MKYKRIIVKFKEINSVRVIESPLFDPSSVSQTRHAIDWMNCEAKKHGVGTKEVVSEKVVDAEFPCCTP